MNPGNEGKGDRFRHQRQRDGQAGQDFGFDAAKGIGRRAIVVIGRKAVGECR